MKKLAIVLSAFVFAVCLRAAVQEPQIEFSYRKSFVRLEANPLLKLNIRNPESKEINAELILEYGGLKNRKPQSLTLKPGDNPVAVRLETRLKPGKYPLTARLRTVSGHEATASTDIHIAPEQGDILPVMMWGGGNLTKLRETGFTHYLVMFNILLARNDSPGALTALDRALEENLYCFDRFSLATEKEFLEKYQRQGRGGKPYERLNLDANNPEAIEWVKKRAARVGEFLADHPGFTAALINSEVRDGSSPSFTGFEEAAFKAYAGYDIPGEMKSVRGASYQTLPHFPASRIIADNNPLLVYYRWFWKNGDGWNPLQSTLSDTYHQTVKRPFLTFFDPAVRVPPLWGSGGGVDAINHWTYTSPDPLRIGLAADELIAMADGRPGQKIMSMTQLFWYRDRSAPLKMKVDKPPVWTTEDKPPAKYITISPDHLKIAFWNEISRRLDAILYHGSQALFGPPRQSYRYTNPNTRQALAEITAAVVKPLGPVLKRIPERQADTAILQSFANTMFSQNNHSYGSAHGFGADLHQALQWAHFQPAIIYDEHIERGDLSKYRVLFLPGAEVLSQSVFDKIVKFQEQGGIVVADEKIVPGILPDISIHSARRYIIADSSKRVFQKLGSEIRKQLEPYYQPLFQASNQDIVLRLRTYRNTDYLFVLNDKRVYGDYVGQYRRIMEDGAPNSGTITLRRKAGAVYDLVRHQAVEFKSLPDQIEIQVELAPADGRIFLLLDKPLAKVELNTPEATGRGETFQTTIRVVDAAGQTPEAIIPVEAVLTDPQGETAAGSGFFAAVDGRLTVPFTPSLNDRPGNWQLTVKDLASGNTASSVIRID